MELNNSLRYEQIEPFVASDVFGRLETLAIHVHEDAHARLMAAMAGSRGSIRRLAIPGWEFPTGLEREFFESEAAAKIESLSISEGLEVLSEISETATLTSLGELHLFEMTATDEDLRGLARLFSRQPLAILEVMYCEFTTGHVREVASCSGARSLRVLNLLGNPIGDEGVRAIVASEPLRGLPVLQLRFCHVTDAGVRMLIESPFVENLVHLDLSLNPISPEMQDAARAAFGDRVRVGNRP